MESLYVIVSMLIIFVVALITVTFKVSLLMKIQDKRVINKNSFSLIHLVKRLDPSISLSLIDIAGLPLPDDGQRDICSPGSGGWWLICQLGAC